MSYNLISPQDKYYNQTSNTDYVNMSYIHMSTTRLQDTVECQTTRCLQHTMSCHKDSYPEL